LHKDSILRKDLQYKSKSQPSGTATRFVIKNILKRYKNRWKINNVSVNKKRY